MTGVFFNQRSTTLESDSEEDNSDTMESQDEMETPKGDSSEAGTKGTTLDCASVRVLIVA